MAAGRRVGYREKEFTGRESDLDVSRRRDYCHSKEEHGRYRNGYSEREISRGRYRNVRDRIRVRQKDTKEREVTNGGYLNSPSTSNSDSSSTGHRQGGISTRIVDREPGELSTGSGSDDAIGSDSQCKDKEVSKLEIEAQSPTAKKRIFSPIIWDREEKEISRQSKNKTIPIRPCLLPPPPLPESFCKSPNLISVVVDVQSFTVKHSHFQSLQPSPVKLLVAPGSVGSFSDIPSGLPLSSPREQWLSNEQEPGQLEEEDSFPARNISTSRWAGDNHSPGDEGISDDEVMPKKRKRMAYSEMLSTILNIKRSSPEIGELSRDGSEGARSQSSESDGGFYVEPFSGGEYHEYELKRNGYMEIDVDNENKEINVDELDIDPENEEDSCKTPEPIVPPRRSINMLQGCRSVFEFERLNRINEGTYGVVYRARDKKTGEIVALKKVKMEKEREGFPLTSLREINILLSFHHPAIVDVKEVVMGSTDDSIFMVMEYMEHDLKGLMETMKQPFSQSEVKCLMIQLLEGVKYLHDNWVLHRDLKTSNLLLNNRGELKICDFGLSRQYGIPLKPYTHLVVTLWYRFVYHYLCMLFPYVVHKMAPELLLGAKEYSTAIDMWSLGCIMAELLAKEPLFSGKSEYEQLDKIFRTLGPPNETIWPGFSGLSKLLKIKVTFVKHQHNLLRKKFPATSFTGSPVLSDAGFDLLSKLLTYDPEKRITAEAALNHEWFHEVPLPKSKDFMPTFPAQHAQDRRLERKMKSPDPLEEQRRKELQQDELGPGGLFGLQK